ncbi:MAG TPA: hypothetical protein VH280_01545 [Verrucomicrobiae bacterium]|jgi:hypothetical protein|nr:hypothetical protein [Verrucomicrobiae bacterium]
MKIKTTTTIIGGALCASLLATGTANAQNLFADAGNTIYKFTPGQSPFATFSGDSADGIAFGPDGDLYVAQNGDILKFTAAGVQSTFATGAGSATFLAFNQQGVLFEADHSGHIFEYSSTGVQSTFASGMSQPEGIAFNSAGDLFVAGGNQAGYINEYTPQGGMTTFTTQVNNPLDIAFNSAGVLFETDVNSGNIYEFTSTGARSTFATGLSDLAGLAFDTSGDLFVASGSNIYEYSANGGGRSTFATVTGGIAGLAFQGETLPVPEPSEFAMLGVGLAGLLALSYQRKKAARI